MLWLTTIRVFFVIIVIFVLLLLGWIRQRGLEGLTYDWALEHRVVALGVDWAPLVTEDLVELILRLLGLLTTRSAIHGSDGIVRFALARWIPLVTTTSPIITALPIIVVVTVWEAVMLLFLLVCPVLHHVA